MDAGLCGAAMGAGLNSLIYNHFPAFAGLQIRRLGYDRWLRKSGDVQRLNIIALLRREDADQ